VDDNALRVNLVHHSEVNCCLALLDLPFELNPDMRNVRKPGHVDSRANQNDALHLVQSFAC